MRSTHIIPKSIEMFREDVIRNAYQRNPRGMLQLKVGPSMALKSDQLVGQQLPRNYQAPSVASHFNDAAAWKHPHHLLASILLLHDEVDGNVATVGAEVLAALKILPFHWQPRPTPNHLSEVNRSPGNQFSLVIIRSKRPRKTRSWRTYR